MSNIQTSVIITFQLEGMHNWPEAKDIFPDVAFLSDMHRHMFHFKMSKRVFHDDRDVEFIRWKREVTTYLKHKYTDTVEVQGDFMIQDAAYLNFGRMSCEQIAKELLEKFDCLFVEVWEDGENGARVEK